MSFYKLLFGKMKPLDSIADQPDLSTPLDLDEDEVQPPSPRPLKAKCPSEFTSEQYEEWRDPPSNYNKAAHECGVRIVDALISATIGGIHWRLNEKGSHIDIGHKRAYSSFSTDIEIEENGVNVEVIGHWDHYTLQVKKDSVEMLYCTFFRSDYDEEEHAEFLKSRKLWEVISRQPHILNDRVDKIVESLRKEYSPKDDEDDRPAVRPEN